MLFSIKVRGLPDRTSDDSRGGLIRDCGWPWFASLTHGDGIAASLWRASLRVQARRDSLLRLVRQNARAFIALSRVRITV
jgi:hypothetical protein